MSQKDYRQDPDFREFVRWSALPKGRRKAEDLPTTKTEWAQANGFDRSTLWRWEQADAFDEMMEEITETWIEESIPKVVATAKQVALEPRPGGHKDRKLLLELADKAGHKMTLKHEGTVEHEHSTEDVRTMTEDQLREAMRAELRKKPQFAEASDEELDELIDAFANAGSTAPDGMPDGPKEAEKSLDYLLASPPGDIVENYQQGGET